jgi:carbamoyltransferase
MVEHILGISAFYHDSAACLLRDGEIVAAAEEERFSRRKGDARFPQQAVEFCLRAAGVSGKDLDAVAFYDKPVTTFSRLLQSYLEYPLESFASFRRSMPVWINEKLKIPRMIDERLRGFRGEIYFCRHHESHAASAFFCSPFEEAAIVVVDGVGEWACTSIGRGVGNRVEMLKEVHFPHSLGLFYSAMTQYLGFKVNFDEYKVMGLAPYGEPRYVSAILDHIVDLKADGSLALNLDCFDFVHGLSMINGRLPEVLGQPMRGPESRLEQFHMDVAASVQSVTTEAMLRLARTAKTATGARHLCLAGGVALNCVANGAIYRDGKYENIYVQPAAGDAGGAIGAALQVWHQLLGKPRLTPLDDRMRGAYLGPSIDDDDAAQYLQSIGSRYDRYDASSLPRDIARWLSAGYIVGLCRGPMEFGPRALGARSILGDPRDPRNQSRINLKIKYRESFRPFAPAMLEERVTDYFDIHIPSPYMLLVMPLMEKKQLNRSENGSVTGLGKLHVVRSEVPAVTHVDYSVRLQTVTRKRNPFFYDVVDSFYALTGCPMVVNTSFNLRGEPIVCTHQDAYHCFMMSDIDILVLGSCVAPKTGIDLDVVPSQPSAREAKVLNA